MQLAADPGNLLGSARRIHTRVTTLTLGQVGFNHLRQQSGRPTFTQGSRRTQYTNGETFFKLSDRFLQEEHILFDIWECARMGGG